MIIVELLICLVASFFFSGLETGLVAADQYHLYSKREKKVFHAIAAEFLILKPERLLSTTLIGNNIANVSAAVFINSYLRSIGLINLSWVFSLILTVVLLIFAEVIPKSFFRQHADTISVRLAPVVVVFYYIFLPVSVVLNVIVRALLFISGQHKASKKQASSKQDLRLLVKLGSREAGISTDALRIVEDIFDFQDTMAREVMIQIHQTRLFQKKQSIEEMVTWVSEKNVQYIPIIEGRPDNIVGYIDVHDLFSQPGASIDDLLRPAIFYPDIKRIPNLLIEMNQKGLDLIFLCNEYGRITGMLTQREIVSEIIGFIPGLTTIKEQAIKEIEDKTYEIYGITDIEDFQNEVGVRIPRGGYDTVGGYLCDRLGRIPSVGTRYRENSVEYEILDADELHIKKIKVSVGKEKAGGPHSGHR